MILSINCANKLRPIRNSEAKLSDIFIWILIFSRHFTFCRDTRCHELNHKFSRNVQTRKLTLGISLRVFQLRLRTWIKNHISGEIDDVKNSITTKHSDNGRNTWKASEFSRTARALKLIVLICYRISVSISNRPSDRCPVADNSIRISLSVVPFVLAIIRTRILY